MAEEFSREVTRQAIARAALALDFKEADEAVLDCLADVMHHYIETIGEVTQEHAEHSGRAYPGIQDAIGALENKVQYEGHVVYKCCFLWKCSINVPAKNNVYDVYIMTKSKLNTRTLVNILVYACFCHEITEIYH